ncbi:SDR family oxidoreductase, partial [Streptomyces sodiiphilus]|uniref:SDR family oxidoreductase n=1 Tax=Streptomyces sodiiphilus TaxID=226217 RepID=UPI0031CE7E4D
ISAALRDAAVHPDTIHMVEAHGTGTSLGDPIEIEGLTRAWKHHTTRTQYCAIGSLKTNIGHLEPAAGLAGLTKIILALQHHHIPPTLHLNKPNTHIHFENTPFYLTDQPTPWPPTTTPRRAALSAFGMGGVNAHLIIEEPPHTPTPPDPPESPHVVRVSGATEETVRELAAAYADRFARSASSRETADLCHTANTGRSPLAFQTAVSGHSAGQLADALRAVAEGRLPVAPADPGADGPADGGHTALVEAVRRGHTGTDWAALSAPGSRITGLPTYPFAKGRYWATRTAAVANGPGTAPEQPRELPTALRTVWREREPLGDTAATAPPVRTRVMATDPGLAAGVSDALAGLGVPAAGAGDDAEAVVVIDEPPFPPDGVPGLDAFWERLRSLVTSVPRGGRLLWATHRSAAVSPGERAGLVPEAAARSMAVRAAGAESHLAVTVLDLDPAEPPAARARQIAAELAATRSASGSVVAYRRDVRFTPERVPVPPGPAGELPADGFYLVTGGLGAVGRHLAGALIERGAKRVGIVGRTVTDAASSPVLRELGELAEVGYLPCDVADEDALATAADRFGEHWGRLLGVVHCSGGVNPFGAMHRRPWADAARVTAPKIAGSDNAVRLAVSRGADFVVLVSSIAGALPEAGRGLTDYALANAYQLALAERGSGGATVVTAHAWPNWAGTGMRADETFAASHSLTPGQALDGFAAHLRTGGEVVFPGETGRLSPATAAEPPPAPAPSPVTPSHPANGVSPVQAAPGGTAPRPGTGTAHAPAPESGAAKEMSDLIRSAFRHVLGADPGHRVLQELGLDSLTIAELVTAIEQRSGLTVDPSLLMRARTVEEAGARLAGMRAGAGTATPPSPPGTQPAADAPAAGTLSSLLRPLLTREGSR